MKLRARAAALIVAMMLPGGAWSADAKAPPVAQAQSGAPTPHAIDLAKRYFAVLHLDQRMQEMMKSIIPLVMDEEANGIEGVTAEQRAAVSEATQEAAALWFPKYMDQMVTVYARTFTEEELQALVDFYDSSIGRSVIQKQGALAPEATRVVREGLPEFKAIMAERLCRKLDCAKLRHRAAATPS